MTRNTDLCYSTSLKKFTGHWCIALLLMVLLVFVSNATWLSSKSEAVTKYCCPQGISAGQWVVHNSEWHLQFTRNWIERGCQSTCGDPTFYDINITVRLRYYTVPPSGEPCSGSCGASSMKIAHLGNATCITSSGEGCRKADCNPLRQQVLAYICNNGLFSPSYSPDVLVTGVWGEGEPPTHYGSPPVSCEDCESNWISSKAAYYQAGFAAGSFESGSGCAVLAGVNCVCNDGQSNCN